MDLWHDKALRIRDKSWNSGRMLEVELRLRFICKELFVFHLWHMVTYDIGHNTAFSSVINPCDKLTIRLITFVLGYLRTGKCHKHVMQHCNHVTSSGGSVGLVPSPIGIERPLPSALRPRFVDFSFFHVVFSRSPIKVHTKADLSC